jgi:hypothetical protein
MKINNKISVLMIALTLAFGVTAAVEATVPSPSSPPVAEQKECTGKEEPKQNCGKPNCKKDCPVVTPPVQPTAPPPQVAPVPAPVPAPAPVTAPTPQPPTPATKPAPAQKPAEPIQPIVEETICMKSC